MLRLEEVFLHRRHCLIPYYPEGSNLQYVPLRTQFCTVSEYHFQLESASRILDHPTDPNISLVSPAYSDRASVISINKYFPKSLVLDNTFNDFEASLSRKYKIRPIMPSQTPTPIALPVPRRRLSPLLTNTSFGQDVTLCLANTLNSKTKSPYMLDENDYAPPAPPPPSPVNFPSESWSTACGIRR